MKKLALILLLSLPVFAQKPQENLYSRAIQACLEKQDLRSVIIVSDFKLTNNLPTRFGEIKVEYLGSSELAQRFKTVNKAGNQKRGAIPVIEIYPLRDQGSKLSFAYNNYWFSYSEKGGFFSPKKINYDFALEGGCKVEIGFDSQEQKFVIEKVEFWGI